MKKLSTVLAALMLMIMAGCSNNDASSTIKENETEAETQETAEKEIDEESESETASELSLEDFDIQEYKYESFGSTEYFLSITNNSDQIVELAANATAYDPNGSVIGAANGSIDVLAPKETSLLSLYFSEVEDIDHIDYSLQYKTDPFYYPVINDLSVEENVGSDKLILVITNKGERAAQFVQVDALFMDADNNVISHDFTYAVDNDSEIKPEANISVQLNSFDPFDHVVWFLSGRADKY